MLDFPMNMSVVLALAAILLLGVALAARKFAPSMARIPLWLGSAALGAAVGVGLTMACVSWLGYVKYSDVYEAPEDASAGGAGMGGGMSAGAMPGGGGGAGMGGGGGGTMGVGMTAGMGTSEGVVSARRLTGLIAKLELLSRGVRVDLADNQRGELSQLLAGIDEQPEVSAAEIESTIKELEQLLSTEQLAALDSIELPRPRPFGGRRPGGPPDAGQSTLLPGGQAPDIKNPFLEETNASRLNRLRDYLAHAGSSAEPGDAVQEVSVEVATDLPVREDLVQPSPPPDADAVGGTN